MPEWTVPYSYLAQQFNQNSELYSGIIEDIKALGIRGDFTLGEAVGQFETAWAKVCGTKHAIGVSNGTSALWLILKARGIGPGDEVITVPNTFIATVGAIMAVGATPVLVDVGDDYLMDIGQASRAVTDRTKAIMPVDLTGNPVRCGRAIQGTHRSVYVIRDACQAIGATINGVPSASMALASAFSLHPLKNINVWGDGGMVVTDNDDLDRDIRLLRNHGLFDRDTVVMPGYNERISTMQAIVGLRVLPELEWITEKRNLHARWYDEALRGTPGIIIPERPAGVRQAFHTYVIRSTRRDALRAYLAGKGVDCKVHYPIPVHMQIGFKSLGYKEGDFPNAERQAREILSLPIHQYLTEEQLAYTIDAIKSFCRTPARTG